MAIPEKLLITTTRPEQIPPAVRLTLRGDDASEVGPSTSGVDAMGYFARRATGEFIGHAPEHLNSRPSWLNYDGLLEMTTKITRPRFWQSLAESTDLKEGVETSITYSNDEVLATTGATYFSSTVTLALLAAAIGNGIKPSIRESGILKMNTKFVTEIGMKYEAPAKTFDEFMQRVDELLPEVNDPADRPEGSLIKYLTDNNAFDVEDVLNGDEQRRSCPAIPFVEVMLQTWGTELRDPDYREAFKTAVEIPEPNRKLRMSGGQAS